MPGNVRDGPSRSAHARSGTESHVRPSGAPASRKGGRGRGSQPAPETIMTRRAGWVATNARLKIAFHFGLPGACAGHGPTARHRAQRAQSLLLLSELTGFGSYIGRPGPGATSPELGEMPG